MKKVALINDLSGIGRCSLNVALPILTHLELQTCTLPTAILSNQTGFKEYSFLDFTPHMRDYYEHWNKIGYQFDGIYSGFLGSKEQVKEVLEFIKAFRKPHTMVMIDPVMGDNGKLYPIYEGDYPAVMKQLIKYADVITPNITEFALLTGYDLENEGINKEKIKCYAEALSKEGPKLIAITGIVDSEDASKMFSMGFDFKNKEYFEVTAPYNGKSYSGTGDIFASILCGYLVQGYRLKDGVQEATTFISKAIAYTEQFDIQTTEGIMYEIFLKELNLK